MAEWWSWCLFKPGGEEEEDLTLVSLKCKATKLYN